MRLALKQVSNPIAATKPSKQVGLKQTFAQKETSVGGAAAPLAFSMAISSLQRSSLCACGGGCPRCKHEKLPIQPKLKIGAPDDQYEREADRVADQIMLMPEPGLQRKPT